MVGFDDGTGDARDLRPPHLLVAPSVRVDWPGEGHRETIRVDPRWLRRIVWEPVTDRYRPATLYYRDGRQLSTTCQAPWLLVESCRPSRVWSSTRPIRGQSSAAETAVVGAVEAES